MGQRLFGKGNPCGLGRVAHGGGLMAGRHFRVGAVAQDAGDALGAQAFHVTGLDLRGDEIAGGDLANIHGPI